MKTIKWIFTIAIALSFASLDVEAAHTERKISFTLSGFFQDSDVNENPIATPFRATTKDILTEISLTTTNDFTNSVSTLLLIESLDDTNASQQFIARKVTRGVTNELDVTGFFEIEPGEFVATEKPVGGILKSAIFYAIDHFKFSTTNATPDGRALTLQGFTKETLAAFNRTLGGTNFAGFAPNLTSDVNGDLRAVDGLVGPVKGRITIGAPKFVATPAVAVTEAITQRVHMEIQTQTGNTLPPLPPLP